MTLVQSDLTELLEAIHAGGDIDVVRSAVADNLNRGLHQSCIPGCPQSAIDDVLWF